MRLSLRVIDLLAASHERYTVAAMQATLNADGRSLRRTIDLLLECGSVKADPWGLGYCYRHPTTSNDSPVWEVKMRQSLERTLANTDKKVRKTYRIPCSISRGAVSEKNGD